MLKDKMDAKRQNENVNPLCVKTGLQAGIGFDVLENERDHPCQKCSKFKIMTNRRTHQVLTRKEINPM